MWQRIRWAREAAGLRQEDLAEIAGGIDRAAVSAWESADPDRRTKPRAQRLQAIASATGVTVDWLLSGIGTGPGPGQVRETPGQWAVGTPSAEPPASKNPREAALLGYFRGLTSTQQDAILRELQEKKQLNDALLSELLDQRKAS